MDEKEALSTIVEIYFSYSTYKTSAQIEQIYNSRNLFQLFNSIDVALMQSTSTIVEIYFSYSTKYADGTDAYDLQ